MTTKKELEQEIIRLDLAFRELADKRHVIDIIYPNIEKFAQWQELRYSIRSLEKNLRNIEFKIWIVGDWPQWLDPEKASHIPCEFTGKTPRIDILHKHLAVIGNHDIREEYFWMNDDIYLVNPVQYADMCLNVAINNLRVSKSIFSRQTVWGRDVLHTYEVIKNAGLPTWNYAAHIPHRYEKEKIQHLIQEFNMLEDPLEITILYYNYWFRDYYPYMDTLDTDNNQGFSVNRLNPSIPNLEAQLRVKKYMNNGEGGMGPVLQRYLEKLFPDKSRFEL